MIFQARQCPFNNNNKAFIHENYLKRVKYYIPWHWHHLQLIRLLKSSLSFNLLLFVLKCQWNPLFFRCEFEDCSASATFWASCSATCTGCWDICQWVFCQKHCLWGDKVRLLPGATYAYLYMAVQGCALRKLQGAQRFQPMRSRVPIIKLIWKK